MKSKEAIERVLMKLPLDGTRFSGMTYEAGICEALEWVLEELEDADFEYAPE